MYTKRANKSFKIKVMLIKIFVNLKFHTVFEGKIEMSFKIPRFPVGKSLWVIATKEIQMNKLKENWLPKLIFL